MGSDDLVDSYVLYRRRPVYAHAYAGPFLAVYVIWAGVWIGYLGLDEHFELGCAVMVVVALSQVLTVLLTLWFVTLLAKMSCAKEPNINRADCVLVHPAPNNGWAEIVPLKRDYNVATKSERIWFSFQKVVYIYDGEERKTFHTLEYPEHKTFKQYNEANGIATDAELIEARQYYGSNKMEMVVPQFSDLFKERATAPFFVFQVFTVLLWCLDDMWYYSLFTLMMLVIFEATLVKQQLRNLTDIRNMGNTDYFIQVYRNRKWSKINTDDLLPGDIVSIGRGANEEVRVPCDLLLLRGPCIVDESMLTGESVPQLKEPLEDVNDASKRELDISADGRLHILFGGTRVLQHTPPGKNAAGIKGPDNGCICYVVRTGFTTSQGRLLRTIMFGVKRVTANNLETFIFIMFLLIFAVAAAAYVWVKGSADPDRSRYKLALECTLILTSVIPPELPIELSLAVNNSLMALQKLGVFCTEPFRIPLAGRATVCCFDKTGTLTTDSLVVDGIAGLDMADDKGDAESASSLAIVPLTSVPTSTTQVLVTCHALMSMDGRDIVGDPLEKACLEAAGWSLTKNEAVMPPKHIKQAPLKILQRWHFSSQLKRMLVIASYQQTNDTIHIACMKGAPETVKLYLANAPADYDATYERLSRQGSRVLALARKPLGQLTSQEVREMNREQLECDLHFCGFVVISCPLKSDSKAMIKEIVESSHSVVMITGDNALTACHVAHVLRFTKRKHTLVLNHEEAKWISIDETRRELMHPPTDKKARKSFFTDYDLCLTGDNIAYMLESDYGLLQQLLPHVRVYARMAPKQKERVINELRKLGYFTIMCGDGTNDVGALKHAHCGVALLSNPLPSEKDKKKEAPVETARPTTALTPQQQALANRGLQARPGSQAANHVQKVSNAQQRLEKMMKEMEEEEKASVVRLGDASIAAPFTSKYNSIQSICHVIKQGRCTLVTTLQMFKILALNALVLAYGQSVLYLDGIKFSDYQATAQGLLLAACFLFISRSKPLTTLSRQRPLPNVLNLYTLLTVTIQFAVHLTCLITLTNLAHQYEPEIIKVDLVKKFEPSLLNTTVYIMSVALQVSTFAVNYRGRPFMESLWENKPLLYSCMFSGGWILLLASGIAPDMTSQFELVLLPDQMRNMVMSIVILDLVLCYAVDRVLNYLFGDVRVPKQDSWNRL